MYIFVPYNLAYMAWTRHYYYLQFPCYILALIMYSFCHWAFLPCEEKNLISLLSPVPQNCFSSMLPRAQHFNVHRWDAEVSALPTVSSTICKKQNIPLPISYLWYQIPANMGFQMFKILALCKKSKMADTDELCKEKRALACSWWGCKLVTPYVKTLWRPLKINK